MLNTFIDFVDVLNVNIINFNFINSESTKFDFKFVN